ncbi:hypothetical protein D3C72_1069810 [compost metagenome]
MYWRVRVVGAHDALQLRQQTGRFVGARGDDAQGAHALAVQRERFRERVRHQQRAARVGEAAHHGAVFGDAVGEALIRHVQERHQAARGHYADDLIPLGHAQVGAGRVVAARMQHDDGAGWHGVQAGQHAVEVHAMGGGIVVGVVIDDETGVLEQRAVIFPARVADVDLRARREALQEVGTDLQCARAADGLHSDGAALLNYGAIGAKYEFLHSLVVGGKAFDRQIGAWRRLFDQDGFCLAYAS